MLTHFGTHMRKSRFCLDAPICVLAGGNGASGVSNLPYAFEQRVYFPKIRAYGRLQTRFNKDFSLIGVCELPQTCLTRDMQNYT